MADKQYPPPTNGPPPPGYYQAPPAPTGSSRTVIVQGRGTTVVQHTSTSTNYGGQRQPAVVQPVVQPVVVQTVRPAPVRSQGGLFDNLGKAFDSAAKDLSNIATTATHAVINPMDLLRNGNKILIQSMTSGLYLKVSDKGLLEFSQGKGPVAQWVVVKPQQYPNTIKLANANRSSSYISIQNGYAVGYGSGGSDCDFTPYVLPDWSVTFESVQNPGAHLGVLPTGQLTAPAQTTKDTDASHFKIFLLGV